MRTITDIKPNLLEVSKQLTVSRVKELSAERRSLTEFLDAKDSTTLEGTPLAGLSPFEAQFAVHGIRTKTRLRAGVRASKLEDLVTLGVEGNPELGKALFTEWVRRKTVEAFYADEPVVRSPSLTYDDFPVGSPMRPYQDATDIRADQIQPAIPIGRLVALETATDRPVVQTMSFEDNTNAVRRPRVGEEGDIPKAKLTMSKGNVPIYKYGRGIEMSYEVMAFAPIDQVGFFISRVALQAQIDQVSDVVDVMVNGDGNGNAATVDTRAALDPASSAGQLTYKAWINWKMAFKNPYVLTTILARGDAAAKILLMDVGTANTTVAEASQYVGTGEVDVINPELSRRVLVGITDDAPSNYLVGFDDRLAIQRIYAPSMDIDEVVRWANKQTQVLYSTVMEGFAKIDRKSVRLLNLT